MSTSTPSKDELIELITANNMVEHLLEWLRSRGFDTAQPISLKDLDYEVLLQFAKEKGLLDVDTGEISLSQDDVSTPEPEEIGAGTRPTKPKKIRSKR